MKFYKIILRLLFPFSYIFGVIITWVLVSFIFGGHRDINTNTLGGETQGVISIILSFSIIGPAFAVGYRELLKKLGLWD